MSETDTDDEEQLEGGLVFDGELEDLRNKDLRGKVAAKTGHRPPDNQLSKNILNSVHAWFTGEFYVKPALLGPGTPPRSELLYEVLNLAIDQLYGANRDDDFDPPLVQYRSLVTKAKGAEFPTRAMNKAELVDFVRAMEQHGDERDWAAN